MITQNRVLAPQPGGFGAGRMRSPKSLPNTAPSASINATTGSEAVQQSKMQREQQDAASLRNEAKSDALRRVGGKTFYLDNDVWVDSEFKADSRLPETVLVFGSEEYFALLKKNPKLGSYFSLGEKVVVVFEGRVYKVGASAP